MKSIIKGAAIILAGILIILPGRWFFYYTGSYQPPPARMPSYERIIVPMSPSTGFSDSYEKGEGIVLIDMAHNNDFNLDEINVLILRLISRGLTIELFEPEDDLKEELLGKEEEPEEELPGEEGQGEELSGEEGQGEELTDEAENVTAKKPLGTESKEEDEEEEAPADVFIIISPREEFSDEEKKAIDEFLENGGKLLLISDPTRRDNINRLSHGFGLIFEPDYLYNMQENDANFRNIFITKFKENDITDKLQKIALYTAGSISSTDSGIAFGNENTFSSFIETKRELSPIALALESKVLAIYDITFMTEPYNGIADNNQLISNVANWLASPAE